MALRLSFACWSAALAAFLPAVSLAAPTTVRASVATDGSQTDKNSSGVSISGDGHFVLFDSSATNLGGLLANGVGPDVFLRDFTAGSTEMMDTTIDEGPANSGCTVSGLSADGRFVVYFTAASNIVPNDTNDASDLFLRDRVTGTVESVSVASDGTQENWSCSGWVSITPDGRYVAFDSAASNLVPGDTNGHDLDVFIRDRVAGTTRAVSVDASGNTGNGSSGFPSVSADGRYVAFQSESSNLVPGDTNGFADIFVRDLVAGTTTRVNVASDGKQANGESSTPSMSTDGRYVAFHSAASNLVPGDTNGKLDVFVRDMVADTITRVSVAADGAQGNGDSGVPVLSASGRYIAFASNARNLVPTGSNGKFQIFWRDLQTGTVQEVSVADNGTEGDQNTGYSPAISADGRFVAFPSPSTNLVPGDTNGVQDVFVRGPMFDVAPAYSMADVVKALEVAGGTVVLDSALRDRYNVETAGESAQAVDTLDAVRIARKVAGLEPNP